VLCSLAIGATWFCSGAASALDIGPVAVPVPVPPVAVTVPPTITVGPVAVPVSQVAPGLGASVNVSPQTGVGASVSLPSSLGPVPVVQVGPGVGVTLPGGTPSAPGVPGGDPRAASQHSASGDRLRSGAGAAARTGLHTRVPSSTGSRQANGAQRRSPASHRSMVPVESQPGAVNASLQHENPDGLWSLLQDLTSVHGLWIALLLIVAIAYFTAGGLLRDALRRRAHFIST
jgi:hypothetical protein